MTIYVTHEGTKLTAEFPRELLEKLYQVEPNCGILFEQFKNKSNSQTSSQKINSENFIAELIQNDYLSVIDPVDG
jgi:hypothetical protein